MTAFMDYYIPRVERRLGRSLTQREISSSMEKYKISWHPKRTATFLKQTEWRSGNPKEKGWYAIQYCWDTEEGTFYACDYFNGSNWTDKTLPIFQFAGIFENEIDAEEFADKEDPER